MALVVLSVLQAHAQDAPDRGRAQFLQSCSFCHGSEATGGAEGPNLVRSSLVRHDSGGDLIAPVIRNGRPSKGMPPINLSAGQIEDVVAFLHERVRRSDLASPKSPGQGFDLKRLLTGDRDAGKRYFYGPGSCVSCHSPAGDLAHIASKYSPVELQARFLYPDSEEPPPVTVCPSSGGCIKGKLVEKDNFELGMQDENGWYHSWPLDRVRFRIEDPLASHIALLSKYSPADIHNLFAYLETLR